MHIARRDIRVPDENGHPKLVKAGEEVHGVEKWTEDSRRSIMQLGWIESVGDAPEQPKKKQKKGTN